MKTPDSSSAESTSALQLLSNGTHHAVVTPTGTGYSVYRDYLLTAWSDDPCEDDYGLTLYVRDTDDGSTFTACGTQWPGGPRRQVVPGIGAVEISCESAGLAVSVVVSVAPGAAVERRLVRIRNLSSRSRQLELTAYAEVVLNPAAAQESHPAFGKLFVQTRSAAGGSMLIATRRPRANGERHPALGLALEGLAVSGIETDRARFIGRGRNVRRPLGLESPLTATLGSVLDPALVLRARLELGPGATREFSVVLAVADEPDSLAAEIASAAGGVTPRVLAADDGGPAGALAAHTRQVHAVRPVSPLEGVRAVTDGEQGPTTAAGANGLGDFDAGGREYRIELRRDGRGALVLPPMPWTNVIGNEDFGLIASEKGTLSTFAANSRLHRLTPWRNDPVCDPHDEAFYVRDESSGEFWSALPGPAPRARGYAVRHGFGYSRWQHHSAGLEHDVTVFVPRADPLRIARIELRNPGPVPRRLALYAYQRWVLGGTVSETRATLEVECDAARGAVFACNPAAGAFAGRRAFAAFAGGEAGEASRDRQAFLGVPGSVEAPRAVVRGGPLSAGTEGEPCAALRVLVTVPAGGAVVVSALLGEAATTAEAGRLLDAYRQPGAVEAALAAVRAFWEAILETTQVATPRPELDHMINGWLAYQTLVCRLWARSAYYQSGGAYGFRDQLQDAASLLYLDPALLRAQLLRNAAHQFAEGDVLHWWHPPASEGIRTKFADDLVWLPYLTAYYVRSTGDAAILDEVVPFVSGPTLPADEDERYFLPGRSAESATLYEHCIRALRRAMTRGAHGLPLFGCGDWNDGMNRVGRRGRGESVWMGFFLYATLGDFLPFSRARDDAASVAHFGAYRADVQAALEASAWDGEWYRRGYYDSGAPLGSRDSDECRIDALAQAWAVISGAAPAARAATALDSLERQLVSEDERLIRLLAPPFEHTAEDPGYIKGYVAGVRENGGQYTHAALWVVRALAEAGRRDRAARLLAMLSPVSHAADPAGVARYKVEPYVIAADVYGVAPHVGRGGWTWYTGSAGWMLRVALESVLGLGLRDGRWLVLAPRIPDDWPRADIRHRRPDGTCYEIRLENPDGCAERVVSARLDGLPLRPSPDGLAIELARDGATHLVEVILGARVATDGGLR
ncbi:MAG: glycosyl transferase [Proteobacteria bacterium]|nr:glycosyl transferase [Pseudomonadota bacterium]